MPYRVKRGVVLVLSSPVDKLLECMEKATARIVPFFVITSGVEGAHGATSLHYEARALDIRDRDWSPKQEKIIFQRLSKLQKTSSALWWLPETDHLHIEWRA